MIDWDFSPVHLLGKTVYESCDLALPLDQEIPTQLVMQWNKWLTSSPYKITIPISIPLPDANINHADIDVFQDSSIIRTCTVSYAVVCQSLEYLAPPPPPPPPSFIKFLLKKYLQANLTVFFSRILFY